jgi:hypothetical protein
MKMGAEPKKIAALVGLVAVAGIVYWMNSASDAPAPTAPARTASDPSAPVVSQSASAKAAARRNATGHASGLGEVIYKMPNNVDPAKVDPTLRLDLLSKVQSVDVQGGTRSIFQIGQPPPPPEDLTEKKVPKVAVIPVTPPVETPKPSTTPPPPVAPTTPPINLKYYGYSTKRSDGEKKAFFLDGEDIIVAAEGEIIKKQYKIVRIGVNSVQMEDTGSKSTQTLPLQQDAAPA